LYFHSKNLPVSRLNIIFLACSPSIFTATSINGTPCSAPAQPLMTVHPNPANGSVVVENVQGKVQLYNAQGRLVVEQPAPTAAPATLDTRALPSGLYYLSGSDATGRMVRQALQVQH